MSMILRLVTSISIILAVSLLVSTHSSFAQQVDVRKMTPEEREAYFAKINAASAKDRQLLMQRMGLSAPAPLVPDSLDPNKPAHLSKRPGSNFWYDEAGRVHVRSEWGNWTNYDESKTGEYTLPDPLVLTNGQKVKNAKTWWNKRRPEILEAYRTEIYGKIPVVTPKVRFEVISVDSTVLGGTAVLKKIIGHIENAALVSDTPRIEINLFLPKQIQAAVPLIVRASSPFDVLPLERKPEAPSAAEQIIDEGWAYATVNTYALQADNGAGLSKGIIGLVSAGQERKPDDWGVLAAWSWGLSRALDYFETEKSINAKQVGIQGHSRWGKTALLAAALDQRWAIVFASCSGAMGASLEKRNYGEVIDIVAGSGEYHWMAGNFIKYGGNWEAMPVDAHELIALIAPRPVFITGGTEDYWIDSHGEFLACVAAGPVYKLLGKKDLGTSQMPAPDVSLTEGDLAFRNHKGGHTDAPDWPVFLAFAKRYFKPLHVK